MREMELYKANQNNTMLCTGCIHLFKPKETLLICKKNDKFIIPTFPPNRCEVRESEDK